MHRQMARRHFTGERCEDCRHHRMSLLIGLCCLHAGVVNCNSIYLLFACLTCRMCFVVPMSGAAPADLPPMVVHQLTDNFTARMAGSSMLPTGLACGNR